VRKNLLLGILFILAGLAILFLLREQLIKLIILVFDFLGIILGIVLILVGIGLLSGSLWMGSRRWYRL
jgi:hypothetical protein